MVLRRIDPFSVLKFGAVVHLAVAAIGFVALTIVVRIVLGSGLVEQVCEIASDVGFLDCGVDQGGLTRLLAVLAVVWAVVQTALVVLLAFLHNLVADLTGGIAVTMDVETPEGARPAGGSSPQGSGAGGRQGAGQGAGQGAKVPPPVVARPGPAGPNDQTTMVEPVDAIEAVVQPRPRRPAEDGGAGGGRLFGDRG
jgi:hypothetical protein